MDQVNGTSTYRILVLRGIPCYFLPDVTSESVAVACSFLERLPSNDRNGGYSCIELPDMDWKVRDVIWSTILSFLAFQKSIKLRESFRIVHLSSGVHKARYSSTVINNLKQRLNAAKLRDVKVAVVGEPAEFCINHKITLRWKDNPPLHNAVCRSAVSCGNCKHYIASQAPNAVVEDTSQQQDVDIEELISKFRSHGVCPHYGLLDRSRQSDLILSTYGAVKESLCGSRLEAERLSLDERTILICDDSAAFEKELETCYDFTMVPGQIQTVVNVSKERRSFLLEVLGRSSDASDERYNLFLKGLVAEQKSLIVAGADEGAAGWRKPQKLLRRCVSRGEDFSEQICDMLRGDLGEAFDTPSTRFLLLKETGFASLKPSFCRCVIAALIADSAALKDPRNAQDVLTSVTKVQALLWNLMNHDIAEKLFQYDPIQNPFRLYRVIDPFPGEVKEKNLDQQTVKFCCLSPEPALNALRKRGIATTLTYGGRAPVEFIILGIEKMSIFQLAPYYSTENKNLFHGIFFKSPVPDSISFVGAFQSRETDAYRRGIGRALVEIVSAVPGIVLVIFPSRAYLDSCRKIWTAMEMDDVMGVRLSLDRPCAHYSGLCWRCAAGIDDLQKAGVLPVCFSRNAGLDGTFGGFMAVVSVCLPFLIFTDRQVEAKKAYLNEIFPGLGEKWYFQDAANAVVAAFMKATSYASSKARIFISLDKRICNSLPHFPETLRKQAKTFQTFEGGAAQLRNFVDAIEPGSDQLFLPTIKAHIARFPRLLLPLGSPCQDFSRKANAVLEHFREDGIVDVFAARLLDELDLNGISTHSAFESLFLPWILGFKHYLLDMHHKKRWPVAVENILNQCLQKTMTESIMQEAA